jgi:hypothetical protein
MPSCGKGRRIAKIAKTAKIAEIEYQILIGRE